MRVCPICREVLGFSYENVKIQIGFAHVCPNCKKDKSIPFRELIKWNLAKDRIHNPYRVEEGEQDTFLWIDEEGIYAPYEHIEV